MSIQLVFIFAGVIVLCGVVGPRWAQRHEGLDPAVTRRMMLWIAAIGLAAGRIHFVANHWLLFSLSPLEALAVWHGGLHVGGAVIGLVLGAVCVSRWYRVPAGKFMDAGTAPVYLVIAAARAGCFINGCCYGTPCSWPWCLRFVDAGPTPVHPLQVYFGVLALGLAVLALRLYPYKRYDGQIALTALSIFSVTATGLEFIRADDPWRVYWGPLPQLTWTALVMSVASLVSLVVVRRQHRRTFAATLSTWPVSGTGRLPGSFIAGSTPRR